MNAIVAKMLGEADFHSPEEKAQLSQHGETGGGGEERKEVALAKQIVAAAEANKGEEVIQLANQLIKMHQRPNPYDFGELSYSAVRSRVLNHPVK